MTAKPRAKPHVQVNLRVPVPFYEKLTGFCDEFGVPMTQLVQESVSIAIDHRRKLKSRAEAQGAPE